MLGSQVICAAAATAASAASQRRRHVTVEHDVGGPALHDGVLVDEVAAEHERVLEQRRVRLHRRAAEQARARAHARAGPDADRIEAERAARVDVADERRAVDARAVVERDEVGLGHHRVGGRRVEADVRPDRRAEPPEEPAEVP